MGQLRLRSKRRLPYLPRRWLLRKDIIVEEQYCLRMAGWGTQGLPAPPYATFVGRSFLRSVPHVFLYVFMTAAGRLQRFPAAASSRSGLSDPAANNRRHHGSVWKLAGDPVGVQFAVKDLRAWPGANYQTGFASRLHKTHRQW